MRDRRTSSSDKIAVFWFVVGLVSMTAGGVILGGFGGGLLAFGTALLLGGQDT